MLAWCSGACDAFAGPTSVSLMKLHGRDTYVIENDVMRLSVLTGGGYIGEVRFISPDPKKAINPLLVPHYATIDPQD